jgi:outer membrane protein insertion porin family
MGTSRTKRSNSIQLKVEVGSRRVAVGERPAAAGLFSDIGRLRRPFACVVLLTVHFLLFLAAPAARASPDAGSYEGRAIAGIEVVLERSAPNASGEVRCDAAGEVVRDPAAEGEMMGLAEKALGTTYSAGRARAALQALFDTQLVACARVEVVGAGPAGDNRPIRVRIFVRRRVLVGEVRIEVTPVSASPVSVDELRARLNMLQPGARASELALSRSADDVQTYLRDRGFYNADVTYTRQPDPTGTRTIVTFNIKLGQQAHVSAFNIDIKGFDQSRVLPALKIRSGLPFTRQALADDLTRIRQNIISMGYLAPQINDPHVELDAQRNLVTVNITGGIGPKVAVTVKDYPVKEKQARQLLPVKREGTIDLSAIVEGERRLRNLLQETGYFFPDVTAVCTIAPPLLGLPNGTPETCQNLNPADLTGRDVNITYQVDRGRRFKLTDIRIEGTNKISYPEIADQLRTQKASVLGFIPLLGYGRGYTSKDLLDQDRVTIAAQMRDLGYRRAKVEYRQGVSLNGEDLIITFVVQEGPLTRIAGVEVRGNQIYTDAALRKELKTAVIGAPFSRSQARSDGDQILNLYTQNGYVDANLDFSTVDLPPKNGDEQVRLVYSITNEGDKVYINEILVNGLSGDARTQEKKRAAVLRAISLTKGDILRTDQVGASERTLYATDAFRQVVITTRSAGTTPSGFRQRDVIIDLEELKSHILSYGGGFSTDYGPLGFVDVRNVNLFGKLRQGAARIRASKLQELGRIEYLDPRFARYGKNQFAPLSISLQYQRDSTVTRFFRSTIDQGNGGIVQRLDQNGKPVDINCDPLTRVCTPLNEPTINRLTFTIESQRVLQEKTRTIVFARYSYEDVRLFNLNSLLIGDVLKPDRVVRLSRFGASFVRDTREQCSEDVSLRSLTTLATSQQPCKYNQFDATRGDYLNIDYGIALRQLGGNISFNRFQANYRRYYQLKSLRNTVLAGNITLGLANVLSPRPRSGGSQLTDADFALPISERFFAGGSTTLRGFGFEEAGPRIVEKPTGTFFNDQGKPVTLNPFTVPLGGNALAVLNLEARVPLTNALQAVPFYDGGNVYRRVSDIFSRHPRPGEDPNLRAHWTNTVGLGFRVKTPFAGALAVDYGFLLNPPEFLISPGPPPSVFRLKRGQINFRFTQTF